MGKYHAVPVKNKSQLIGKTGLVETKLYLNLMPVSGQLQQSVVQFYLLILKVFESGMDGIKFIFVLVWLFEPPVDTHSQLVP